MIKLVYEWYEVQGDKARDLRCPQDVGVDSRLPGISTWSVRAPTGLAAVPKVAQCTKFHRGTPAWRVRAHNRNDPHCEGEESVSPEEEEFKVNLTLLSFCNVVITFFF